MPVTTTFSFQGAGQTYTVPAGITAVVVECWGAQGGSGSAGPYTAAAPGKGGYVKATVPVSPGDVLLVQVGGQGVTTQGGAAWPDGGRAANITWAASGGGSSRVFQHNAATLANLLVVAGAGGGAGVATQGTNAGAYGGGDGGNPAANGGPDSSNGGGAGTLTAGGSGASTGYGATGGAGSSLQGGAAAAYGASAVGGGGGGGYFGGGGGAAQLASAIYYGTGGGGGRSAAVSTAQGVAYSTGVQSGNGLVKITPAVPDAPALVSPPNNAILDLTAVNRFSWGDSFPLDTDSQSKFDLQYSSDNGATWTLVNQSTPNLFWDAPAGTFAATSYQWQVRVYDQAGTVGPWSGSEFFTAAVPAAGPVWVDPINGQTITTGTYDVSWSFPNQQAFEIQRVADDGAGNPVTATEYYGTGQVVGTAHDLIVPFETDSRYEHLRIRGQSGGLWTAWTDVRLFVDYTRPATPSGTVTADPASGSITVAVTNPAPTGTEPAVVYNRIYVTRGSSAEILPYVSSQLPPNTSWTDWTPASNEETVYRVEAVGANGTTSTTTVNPPGGAPATGLYDSAQYDVSVYG